MARGLLWRWVTCAFVALTGCRDASSGPAPDAAASAAVAPPGPPIQFGWSAPSEGLSRTRAVSSSVTFRGKEIDVVDLKVTLHETIKDLAARGTPGAIWVKFDSFALRLAQGDASDPETSTTINGKSYTVLSGRTPAEPDVVPGWVDREQAQHGDAGFPRSHGSDGGGESAQAETTEVRRFYRWMDGPDLIVIPVPFRVLHVGDSVPELVDALRLVLEAYDPGMGPVGAMFRGSVVLRSADATQGQFCYDFGFLTTVFVQPHERTHKLVTGCVGVRRADGWIMRVEAHVDEKVEGKEPPDVELSEQWVVEMAY